MSLRNNLRKNTLRGDLARQWAEAQGVQIEDLLRSERWSKMVDGSNAPSLIITATIMATGIVIFHESLWMVLGIGAVTIAAFIIFTNMVMNNWVPRCKLYQEFCSDLRDLEQSTPSGLTKIRAEEGRGLNIHLELNEHAENVVRAQALMILHAHGIPDYDAIGREANRRTKEQESFNTLWTAGKKFGLVEGKGTYFDRARVRLGTK